MSASVCSSSLRIPVRATRSSTDLNLNGGSIGSVGCDGTLQSCEHVLQKYDPAFTISIIDSSSHPHFGHIRVTPATVLIPNPRSLIPDLIPAFSIERPTSSR